MKRANIVAACSAALALSTLVAPLAGAIEVEASIPSYQKQEGISGNLNSVGSDTLNNLMTFWAEQFRKYYPNVNIQIEGKGSSTAPPALIEGTAQLGPMSRAMKSEELEGIEKKYGYPPTQIAVALDALAVYVNKDNPIDGLSLPEVDAVFGKARKLGHSSDVTTWGQVGLSGDWAKKPISIYGRNSASGTYGYFKKVALGKGDFKDTVKEQPGSAAVVLGVTEDLGGIGYSGIGYKTSGVKAIAIAKEEGGTAYEPSYENVLSKKYPIGRALYVYVLKEPGKPLNPMVAEFLKLALSKEGQETVLKDGYLPLPGAVVTKELGKL
jgi:phosphate transport system substrate-binding protein